MKGNLGMLQYRLFVSTLNHWNIQHVIQIKRYYVYKMVIRYNMDTSSNCKLCKLNALMHHSKIMRGRVRLCLNASCHRTRGAVSFNLGTVQSFHLRLDPKWSRRLPLVDSAKHKANHDQNPTQVQHFFARQISTHEDALIFMLHNSIRNFIVIHVCIQKT